MKETKTVRKDQIPPLCIKTHENLVESLDYLLPRRKKTREIVDEESDTVKEPDSNTHTHTHTYTHTYTHTHTYP